MDSWLPIDIGIILALQNLGTWLEGPMEFFSRLGTEEAYLIIMPMLYWCVDAVLGLKVGLMLLLTNSLNSYLKLAFRAPRPYWVDDRVLALSSETTFGVPSGHAQNSLAIWGLLALKLRNERGMRSAIPIAAILIFLIGISRLYLGVHFVRDVLAGWLFGALLLWAVNRWMDRLGAWLKGLSTARLMSLSVASSILMILIFVGLSAALGGWETPVEWIDQTARVTPDDPIDPFSVTGIITAAGTWLGITAGTVWYSRRYGMFDADGTPLQKLLRYLVGMIGLGIIYIGLKLVLPEEPLMLAYILRYLRYAMLGIWVSAGAPLAFRALGLSATRTTEMAVQ